MALEGLSEEYQGNETLSRFNDVNDLAKSFIETKAMVGSSIRIPGDDASDEIKEEFHKSLIEKVPNLTYKPDADNEDKFWETMGKPPAHDKYEMPEIQVPEGVKVDETQIAALRQMAYDSNLTQKQFNTLVEKHLKSQFEQIQLTNDNHNAAIKNLREKWGLAADERFERASKAANATDAPAEVKAALETGTASAEMVEWFYNISTQLGDEAIEFKKVDTKGLSISTDEAKLQLDEIYSNKEHDYFNPSSPGYKDAVIKVQRLMSASNGEKFDESDFRTRMGWGG